MKVEIIERKPINSEPITEGVRIWADKENSDAAFQIWGNRFNNPNEFVISPMYDKNLVFFINNGRMIIRIEDN